MSAANKGVCDFQVQVERDKLKEATGDETSSAKVTNFFTISGSKSDDAVLAAEVVFAFHTVKHPSSYKSADCTSVIFKTTFSDSEIARKFSSSRRKTEAIIYSVIAQLCYRKLNAVAQK